MNKFRLLAVASLSVSLLTSVRAVTYTENFTSDPSADGWQFFGNTNQLQWDSTNHVLDVTWDTTQTNSFFYHPLAYAVTANDDFSVEFDLNLSDIASGVEPGKTTPMQLGFEFLDLATATNASFQRGNYGTVPNIAGFDYFGTGSYTYDGMDYTTDAATVPAFVSGTDSYDYAPQKVNVFDNELPLGKTVHVSFSYAASNQTAVISVTTNGVPLTVLPPLALNGGNGFVDPDYGFQMDSFCICSFSSAGDDYDSILAHGKVAHVVVSIPPPAQSLGCSFTNGTWQVQFADHLNWLYTLQRTTNFTGWQDVSAAFSGNGTNLVIADSTAPSAGAFYRVSAARP